MFAMSLNRFLKPLGVYLSWWGILYGSSLIIKKVFPNKPYMLLFYMCVLICIYTLYLLLPFLIKGKEWFSDYLKRIHLQLTLTSFIISLILLIVLTVSIFIHLKIGDIKTFNNSLAGLNWLIYLQPPLVEELLFRGLIPSFYQNKWLKYLISTSLFTSLHIAGGLPALLFSFIIGSVLYFLTYYLDSIVPSIILHYTINTGLSFALIGAFFTISLLLMFSLIRHQSLLKNK